jgi:hypothetical protein
MLAREDEETRSRGVEESRVGPSSVSRKRREAYERDERGFLVFVGGIPIRRLPGKSASRRGPCVGGKSTATEVQIAPEVGGASST